MKRIPVVSRGRVMLKKRRHGPAPSVAAASRRSRRISLSPARKTSTSMPRGRGPGAASAETGTSARRPFLDPKNGILRPSRMAETPP